ncbi:acyl-CoA thioesterase [Thalassovita aquimarina]|uniref:Acyl-CoA thioesterase n=1 Tax=Thalassovita aquimarina TaxID=2785917 RepID=A0ABS5HVC1_9RHOB|nr:acyl-CoA thioesterase [Thalassovita aquimarina]MBR9652930.1 acyl-CoA thioesterase [Thalassovita aquimarina]
MFPMVRLVKEFVKYRNAPALPYDGTHVSRHMCLPWDLDPFMELNNGRTLTLFDLGRLLLAKRVGLIATLKREGWGMTMAGSCVRYRRRIRVFETFEMRSRALGWDDKFLYIDQSMWKKNGDCANHVVYRAAITDANGIVGTDRVRRALAAETAAMELPEWVLKWIDAENARPWPPIQD